jgi:hypothetical protein
MANTNVVHFDDSKGDNDKQTVNICDGYGCTQEMRWISRSFASLWQRHGMELCQTHQMGIYRFTSNQFHGESDPPESGIVKVTSIV